MKELAVMETMSPEQRVVFFSYWTAARKSATTGVLLAVFLGGLGVHHFYLGRVGLGVLYLVFCWTFVPAFVALVEAFLMSGRVARYNDALAIDYAGRLKTLG